MIARWTFLAALLLLAPCASAQAASPAPAATAAPSPSAAEATFVATVMRELPRRFATTHAAVAAGYVRYTNEDRTGAISYVNVARWNSNDPREPAQLWYDVGGRLIGADYSVRQADAPNGPSLFGIDAARFGRIGAHVHYVTCTSVATHAGCVYGKAVGAKKYAAIGDVAHPTADGLVKLGAVTDPASVATVFLYPAIFDVSVWVVPNPLGQFAEHNPNVTPSAGAVDGE